jgi:2-polyprenyl-6-methoxyphenol hydroxylase-like FAD-dependent oxidoreductase
MFVYRASSSSVSNCFMQHLNQRSELMATILIAGGSLSGLLHAVFLRRDGQDVAVYERVAENMSSRGGGIATQAPLWQALENAGVLQPESKRPHPGAGTTKAFQDAWALRQVLLTELGPGGSPDWKDDTRLQAALAQYDHERAEPCRAVWEHSRFLGTHLVPGSVGGRAPGQGQHPMTLLHNTALGMHVPRGRCYSSE